MANTVIILPAGAAGEFTSSGLKDGGRVTLITVNDTTWTAMKRSGTTLPTGSGPLIGRNAICIRDQSAVELKVQYDDGTAGYVGMKLPAGAERHYDITDAIDIFVKSSGGDQVVALEEIG